MQGAEDKYILVVEDSDEDFEAARRALKVLTPFAPVVRTDSGAEAIAYLTGEHGAFPTVIVLDLHLPDMGDEDLTSLIASRRELDDVPVFVMTGSSKVFSASYGPWPANWKLVHKQMELNEIAREMVQVKIAWDRATRPT